MGWFIWVCFMALLWFPENVGHVAAEINYYFNKGFAETTAQMSTTTDQEKEHTK